MTSTARHQPEQDVHPLSRHEILARQGRALVDAIRRSDEAAVQAAVIELSQSRRIFAPLVFVVGAFVMLFQGVRLLFSNWRLTLVQVLPAMWIWAAMLDLKSHVFKGQEFQVWHGSVQALLVVAITLLTAVCFYLNSVFAFAILQPGTPQVRPAFTLARRHLGVVLTVGFVIGLALGVSAIVVPRFGLYWFALSLGIVIGAMMLTYVTVPARVVGIRSTKASPRDKMAATVIGGTLGAIVCTPPYLLGRGGILLLGSPTFFALGVVLLTLGLTLQAGATGAVKAIKMSAKLAAGELSRPELVESETKTS